MDEGTRDDGTRSRTLGYPRVPSRTVAYRPVILLMQGSPKRSKVRKCVASCQTRNPQIPITFKTESTLSSIHFSASSRPLRPFVLVSSNPHQPPGSVPTRRRRACVPFPHSEDTIVEVASARTMSGFPLRHGRKSLRRFCTKIWRRCCLRYCIAWLEVRGRRCLLVHE